GGAEARADEIRLAIEGEVDGAPYARIGERRLLEVDENVVVHVGVVLDDEQLGLALLGRLRVRLVPAAAPHVELPGLQRGDLRRAVLDHDPLHPAEISPTFASILPVLHELSLSP